MNGIAFTFRILTQKLRTTNNGRPLSFYQEACCGVTSGATAALVWYPIYRAYVGTASRNLSYGSLFSTLCHLIRDKGAFALWKGSGLYIGQQMSANVGMLASYNRSQKFLMESINLSKMDAQICAGIISGFFAAACSHPCEYVKAIKDVMQKDYHLGNKHSYRKIPLYISKILTPYSGFKFYTGFTTAVGRWASYSAVRWFIFENIVMLEKKYMESSTRDSQTRNFGKD